MTNEDSQLSIANPIYHDHSNDPEVDALRGSLWKSSSSTLQGNETSASCLHSFPMKLHYMLSELEKDGLSHVLSWQPHGRCFLVHNQEHFVKNVLPLWFRQSQFASFRRQLNLYGFRRLSAGKDKGAYYHEYFLRGKPGLCCRIQRIKVKGIGRRKPSSSESEPNFYFMPFLPMDKNIHREIGTTSVIGSDKNHTDHLDRLTRRLSREQDHTVNSTIVQPGTCSLKPFEQQLDSGFLGGVSNRATVSSLLRNINSMMQVSSTNDANILFDNFGETAITRIPNTENAALQNYQYILASLGNGAPTTSVNLYI